MFQLQNAFAIFQNVCNWLFLAHVCSARCNSISTCVFPSFHLHPTNISNSKFSSLYTFLSPHSWFSLILAHSPSCILLCTLCSKVLNAFVLIVQKCSLKQKKGHPRKKPSHKLIAWVDSFNMKLLSCQVLNEKLILIPYSSPLFFVLVLGLKLWPLNQTNMSFQCHVCTTLWISLICNNQILWTMLRNWM